MADHQMFQDVKGELLQELRSMLMQHNMGRLQEGGAAEEPSLVAENAPKAEGEGEAMLACPDCGADMTEICPECGYSEGGPPEEEQEEAPPQRGPRFTKSARTQPADEFEG